MELLNKDGRNFHVWNYWRWLAQHYNGTLTFPGDFEKTQQLLKVDFSNYSAFAHRIYWQREHGTADSLQKDKDFVKECLFISVNDETLWSHFLVISSKYDIVFLDELFDSLDDDDFKAKLYYCRFIEKHNIVENK